MKTKVINYKWIFFWYIMLCVSAFYEVHLHFNKRNLFQEYQIIASETERLEMEWRELQLDYSAFTSGQKIGLVAEQKASMSLPDSKKINLLKKDEVN
jgi:cell division protein FtsL|tara:strand:+ start:1733 stop:2023 length:291 start_codon:yes stop_codon:yes gene_type:complete